VEGKELVVGVLRFEDWRVKEGLPVSVVVDMLAE
jgi:hypothetical protein